MNRPKTKIVCTLGPATETKEIITALVRAGMSVARINLSHGNRDQHSRLVEAVRAVSTELGTPIALMADIPGTKYRTGPMAEGAVTLRRGDQVTLSSREILGTCAVIGVAPAGIHRDAAAGDRILVDDGLVELRALAIPGLDVLCEVVAGGRVAERKGVVIPGKPPSLHFPDEKATDALRFAAEQGVDFVAVSTVGSVADVETARQVLNKYGADPPIVSKIERVAALENFDSILAASDAIMVARGDMGVDVPLAKVPVIQKRLIARCNVAGKPVITATQMLESMIRSPMPTRAEVTDVANAIFDGTDAIMLSGETSVGEYPTEAVRYMAQVAVEAEDALPYEMMLAEKRRSLERQTDDAMGYNACQTALQLHASLIVAFTESGSTAGRVAKYRPSVPVLALTPRAEVQRLLALRWGVTPILVRRPASVDDFFAIGEEQAIRAAGLGPGSLVVLVAGVPIGVPGGTNLLRVLTIPSSLSGDAPPAADGA